MAHIVRSTKTLLLTYHLDVSEVLLFNRFAHSAGPGLSGPGSNMAQNDPKMAQDGPKTAPRWPKMAQDTPKMDQVAPHKRQDAHILCFTGFYGPFIGVLSCQEAKTLYFCRFLAPSRGSRVTASNQHPRESGPWGGVGEGLIPPLVRI